METLIQFALLCTAVYYIVARAEITRPLWEALDGVPFIGPMLRCPACTGTWIGAALSHLYPIGDHDHGLAACSAAVGVHAAFGMVLTGLGFGLLKVALDHSAVKEEE